MTTSKTKSTKKTTKKSAKAAKKKPAKAAKPVLPSAPIIAKGSPKNFRARVRMYRHGLGDCFLVTFPRKKKQPFHMLIDCGALGRDKVFMTGIVEHIRDTIRNGKNNGKAKLDVVVATHEHKDHVSGFNQAKPVFEKDFDFGAVWLAWTENLTQPEIKKFKEAKANAVRNLQLALNSPRAVAAGLDEIGALLGFSEEDDKTATLKVADAMEYLKLRGKKAGDLRYCEPGEGPFELDGVEGVRVYVLAPSHDPGYMKVSEVTKQMQKDDTVYHLTGMGYAGMDALGAAVSTLEGVTDPNHARFFPFSDEHRITRETPQKTPNPYFQHINEFVSKTYDDAKQDWRKIDDDWLTGFGQLALDLDNDTNNTSLVLAFEFVKTREVLLFVGDAQIGNWKSWAKVEFKVPGRDKPMPALELVCNTVFYKVGHHCSHNATLKRDGLELMTRDDLVAFIPLDKETAGKQGKKGWDMPAGPLFKALKTRTNDRVSISDIKETLTANSEKLGVRCTDLYIDYFLT